MIYQSNDANATLYLAAKWWRDERATIL